MFSAPKCLILVFTLLCVLLFIQPTHTSLVPPSDDALRTRLLESVQLSLASSESTPRLIVFLCPPASFVHHQITLSLELYRRGHHIIFATSQGFQRHLDNQLKLFLIDNPEIQAPPIDVIEIDGEFNFNENGFSSKLTQTRPSDRKTGKVNPMTIYENSFAKLTDGLDKIKSADGRENPEEQRKQKLIFSGDALIVLPGPWATPIKYCRLHNLNYIIMLPSPFLARIFSSPLYIPKGMSSMKNFGKGFIDRGKLLWGSLFNKGSDLDTKPATQYPTLRLVQAIPAMTHLRSYSPLTVFTGPLVSKERQDPRHLSNAILTLLENDEHLPIIYLSMGSYAQLGSEQIEKLAEAFLPFDGQWGLIWALSKDQQESISNSTQASIESLKHLVLIEDWIQSPAVLNHSNTKLFVSHCGANGLSEALVTGTPVLGLPLFGDQPDNCAAAEENLHVTICRSIYDTPTLELRQLASDIVLNKNHSIREHARRAKVLSTKGYHGVDTAADWIETASSLNGDFSFLATPPEREGFIKSYCLDILVILILIVIVMCLIILRGCGIRQAQKAESLLAKEKGIRAKKAV